jgi:hypothetical protein
MNANYYERVSDAADRIVFALPESTQWQGDATREQAIQHALPYVNGYYLAMGMTIPDTFARDVALAIARRPKR